MAKRTCNITEHGNACPREAVIPAKDGTQGHWCRIHYKRWQRTGDPAKVRKVSSRKDDYVKGLDGTPDGPCVIPVQTQHRPKIRVDGKQMLAARYVWTLAHGEPAKGLSVLHECGNGHNGCVNIGHLYLGDHSDNRMDYFEHQNPNHDPTDHTPQGRGPIGESAPSAKLTEQDVRHIRAVWAPGGVARGGNTKALAEQYGVGTWTINDIARRRTWKHVT